MKLLNPAIPPNTAPAALLQAVILDWAGTTVDHGSLAPARTLQRVFAQAGITLSESETRRDMGLPKKEHIRAILQIARVRDAWKNLRSHSPRDADADELYEQFIPLQLSCLAEHSALIPGALEAVQHCRKRGLKIGSTTGYTRAMLDLLIAQNAKADYVPDCSLCPEDVGAGRPHPFMIYECAVKLQVSPLSAVVKVGDTPADIQEGLNAGAWSVGVAGTGNGIALSLNDFQQLSATERETRLAEARTELQHAGAHFVIDTLADLPALLDNIDARLRSTPQ